MSKQEPGEVRIKFSMLVVVLGAHEIIRITSVGTWFKAVN